MSTTVICLLLSNLPDLQSLPGVASAKVAVKCDDPKLTIIHVRDWHFVDRQSFALDVQDASDEPLTDDEVDTLFAEHRETVAAIQKQQMRVMLALVKQAGIKQVFQEGLVAEELAAYRKRITVLRDFRKYLPDGDRPLDQFTRYEYETDMLQIGVPGQLWINNKIKSVASVEDEAAYKAANPIRDGKIVLDKSLNEAREDAIVRNTLRASETAVLVLGGAHDISDNVPAGVELIVLTVQGYPGE